MRDLVIPDLFSEPNMVLNIRTADFGVLLTNTGDMRVTYNQIMYFVKQN